MANYEIRRYIYRMVPKSNGVEIISINIIYLSIGTVIIEFAIALD